MPFDAGDLTLFRLLVKCTRQRQSTDSQWGPVRSATRHCGNKRQLNGRDEVRIADRPRGRCVPGITSAVACCKNGGRGELTVGDEAGRRGDRRCGLCSLVARAFRRAVCGAPSRRGSGDSYQELTAPPPAPHDEETVQVSRNVKMEAL